MKQEPKKCLICGYVLDKWPDCCPCCRVYNSNEVVEAVKIVTTWNPAAADSLIHLLRFGDRGQQKELSLFSRIEMNNYRKLHDIPMRRQIRG